jgi:nucleotide-binding universal stress UspA family protein
MKTIVLATDFSAPAETAMMYAGQLASNTNASLLLLHVYQIPVGMNDMPVLMVSADELKKNADAGLERAKDILQKKFEGLQVQTESRLGDVTEELSDVCKNVNPFVVVAGKHGATGVERILFGSTSLSIVRHLAYPVIVVPDGSHAGQIQNTALAVDASFENISVKKIKTIVEELQTRLHIVHVKQEKSASLDVSNLASELKTTCKTIYDHEFVHGIETYIRENNIDLLIILPRKHNLLERVFLKTHTPELLKKISIPIMCINEDLNRES